MIYKKNISDQSGQNDKLAKYKNAGEDFFDNLLLRRSAKTDQIGQHLTSGHYEDAMSEFILTEKNPFVLYQAGRENNDIGLLVLAKEGFIELLKLSGFKDIGLAYQLIDKVIVCAEKSGDHKKVEAFKEIKTFRAAIENSEAFFRERRKNKLKPEQNIYELIMQWATIGHKESQIIYAFHKKYAHVLGQAGMKAEAITQYQWLLEQFPDDLYNYIYFADFYTEYSKNQNESYLLAKDLLQKALDKYYLSGSDNKQILTEIKIAYWRLCRQNDRFDKCKGIVKNELEHNDISFIKEHFRIYLGWTEKDIGQYNFAERFARVIPEINKLFLANGLNFKELVPGISHLHNITKINFYNDIQQDSRFSLGSIYVEQGDLENIETKRKINVFLEGLTEEEIYMVLLHEIGHNSYFALSKEQQDLWRQFAEKYELNQHYTHQKHPEMEAYADCYAAFILFNDLWRKIAVKEGTIHGAKNLVLFNFFKRIFWLDTIENKDDIIFEQEKLKEDFNYFNKNIKNTLFLNSSSVSVKRILHQHSDSHRTNTARDWSNISGGF